jgi:hypothetical protein
MTKETNPQAFPSNQNSVGMSLRDYFAAEAMQGVCANPEDIHIAEDENYSEYVADIARCAYQMADAMLKARGA